MKGAVDACGCFPTGRYYPGIAHLLQVRAVGVATELEAEAPWTELPIACIDTETTGRDPEIDRVIEVGVVVGLRGGVTVRHGWLVNPGVPISAESSAVHGIVDADVQDKPAFREVLPEIVAALAGAIPAAYNAAFDRTFLLAEIARAGETLEDPPPALRRDVDWLDPLVLARELYADEQSRALAEMASRLGVELVRAHRATDDAEAALLVLYGLGKDPRVPPGYAALVREQRRLSRLQDEARRFWRKA
jgi:DNA polymerase-3 subunit epsilon